MLIQKDLWGQATGMILLNNPPFLETPSACLKTAQKTSSTNGVQTILILGEGVLMAFLGVDFWPVGVLQQNQGSFAAQIFLHCPLNEILCSRSEYVGLV